MSSPLPMHLPATASLQRAGAAVVVATTARVVATVLDADIYEVTGTRILTTKAVRAAR